METLSHIDSRSNQEDRGNLLSVKKVPPGPLQETLTVAGILIFPQEKSRIPAKARSSWGGVRGGPSYKKGLPDSSSFEHALVSGLFALLCLILIAGVAWAQSPLDVRPYTGPEKDVPIILITLGNKTIQAVVAGTESSRVRGLLGWETITEDAGMLLDFEREGKYAIHMQGMKFPIDALWIDGNRVIKLIYPEIRPNSGMIYPSMVPSRYCLEIKAGLSKKFGIKIGQQVQFRHPETPPRTKGRQ